MEYDCRIEGDALICTITADRDLTAPLFCFSAMAPIAVRAGGEVEDQLGGYTEVRLPDLAPGLPHRLTLVYAAGFRPANRAWMPMGPRLKAGAEIHVLPPTPTGCRPVAPLPKVPVDGLPILPQPTRWEPAGGTLDVSGFSSDDPAITAAAGLASRLHLRFAGETSVRLRDEDMPEDAYRLEITPEGVTLAAGSYGGRFYGAVTLMLLLADGPLPCGVIEDAPRFGWRGQHLDCARHFYRPETIHALIDVMALMKLNRFHWHFADDEAFRLEIDGLPELWQATRLRGEGHLMPALFSDSAEAGGSYSKEDAKTLVEHARALNIEVMPEIEAPAHALALARVYPEVRDPEDRGHETSVQGYRENVVNPAMPKTWDVLETMVREVGALFPFGHIHLGCDELPEETWMGSPAARALMEAEGLETTQDLQGWTIHRLAGVARAAGMRPAAWEEAAQGANGGIGHGALLFSWTGQAPGIAAARRGYDVVMCPAQHVYFDMAASDDPDGWGASWAAFVGLEDTVAWSPVPEPDIADRIAGVQGCFWSEFTTEDAQIWPMLLPRMLGMASVAWQEEPPGGEKLAALAARFPVSDRGPRA